jgi:uncharacterized protein YndB with AHSA1/START domain
MNKQGSAGSTATNAVRLHRVLAAKPDKVYRAFTTADAIGALAATHGLNPVAVADPWRFAPGCAERLRNVPVRAA